MGEREQVGRPLLPRATTRGQGLIISVRHRFHNLFAADAHFFAARFASCLYARTLASDSSSTMSATERCEPSSP